LTMARTRKVCSEAEKVRTFRDEIEIDVATREEGIRLLKGLYLYEETSIDKDYRIPGRRAGKYDNRDSDIQADREDKKVAVRFRGK